MSCELFKTASEYFPKNATEFRALVTSTLLILAPLIGSAVFDIFDDEYLAKLRKPTSAPPKPVYIAIWAVLYLIIGYANYLAWEATPLGGGCLCSLEKLKAYVTGAPGLFWLQMIPNYGSMWVFFKFHNLGGTVIVTVALNAAAVFVTYRFYLLDQTAALLMIPYLLVLLYDLKFTYDFYKLNKPKKAAEIIKKNK